MSKRGTYTSPSARYHALLEGALAHVEWAKNKEGPEPLQHIKEAQAYLVSKGVHFRSAAYKKAVMECEPQPESNAEKVARYYSLAKHSTGVEKEHYIKLAMEAAAEDSKIPGLEPGQELI